MPKPELYENLVFSDQELPAYVGESVKRSPGTTVRAHWHEQLEMHFVVQGVGEMFLGQDTLSVQEGDLVMVNRNTLHRGECPQGPYCYQVLVLDVADYSKELARQNLSYLPLIRGNPVIKSYFEQIFAELKEKKPGYRSQCRGLITQLLVYLSRNFAQSSVPDRELARRRKHLERLNGAICYIEENYRQPITVAQLARICCLSEDRFGHLFREVTGQPPLQYVNALRLRKALRLLHTGDYTAGEAAEAVGFLDYNHFGRLFRKYHGISPSQARREAEKIAESYE